MAHQESYQQFCDRVQACSNNCLPPDGMWETNPNLLQKVDAHGHMRSFMGNTVVFTLDEPARQALTALQQSLYDACGDLLADRLAPDTLHLTLHDLASGAPSETLTRRVAGMDGQVKACVRQMAAGEPVQMQSTALFPMVRTSVVLGFVPSDPTGWEKLCGHYERLERLAPLGYPWTPHVTLAYFRPGRYAPAQRNGLRQAMADWENRGPLALTLAPQALEYQCFSDMNHFWRVP